jgi:hypothetical protein
MNNTIEHSVHVTKAAITEAAEYHMPGAEYHGAGS